MTTPAWKMWRRSLVIVGDEAFTPAEWRAITHGTAGGYVHWGCRCEDCRAWMAAYRKAGKA